MPASRRAFMYPAGLDRGLKASFRAAPARSSRLGRRLGQPCARAAAKLLLPAAGPARRPACHCASHAWLHGASPWSARAGLFCAVNRGERRLRPADGAWTATPVRLRAAPRFVEELPEGADTRGRRARGGAERRPKARRHRRGPAGSAVLCLDEATPAGRGAARARRPRRAHRGVVDHGPRPIAPPRCATRTDLVMKRGVS